LSWPFGLERTITAIIAASRTAAAIIAVVQLITFPLDFPCIEVIFKAVSFVVIIFSAVTANTLKPGVFALNL